MSYLDVMYGPLGSVNQGFQNNLGLNAANMASSNALVNSWQNVPQVPQSQLYGGGSFGAQPAYYAALGAAYGRAVPSSSASAIANANRAAAGWGAIGGGGIGSDAARAPNQPAIQPAYRAPMSSGWGNNEGASAPAAPQVYNRGEFNPQTYGWDHNEGASSASAIGNANRAAAGWGAIGGPQVRSSGSLGTMNPTTGGYQPGFGMGLPNQNFQDLWNARGRVYQPPGVIESPYGPGGYPPMAPRGGEGQSSSNTNWYGMPNASS